MNTVAIVKVVWITTVFATSALIGEALIDARTGTTFEYPQGRPNDAGVEAPRGSASARDLVMAWSSWDETL